MKHHLLLIAASVASMIAPGLALADKPDKHEKKEKHREERRMEQRDEWREARGRPAAPGYFDAELRRIIVDYYGQEARAGKCPPGLAKKRNGCLPPGQAKKWVRGQPLPAGVSWVALPPELLRRLPPPPPDHRYVQVAGDILLIAIGTSLVVDAVEDLFR
ncbi:MAG: RcnB family protein [Rhodocyclaceae bacterium]|nr:RcnB family protein [Rhodocyclaceae bacterium]